MQPRRGEAALMAIKAPFAEINSLIDATFGGEEADRVAALLTDLTARLSDS